MCCGLVLSVTTACSAMRFALPVLFILIVSAVIVLSHRAETPVSDTPDLSLPVYSACTADSDCTLVSLPCGAVEAARKDRRKELQHYYNSVKTRIRCARTEPPQMLHAVCTAKHCTTRLQNSQDEEE